MIKYILFIISFLFFTTTVIYAEGATVLGILTEPQCLDDSVPMVKVLFAKQDNEWISLANEGVAESFLSTNMSFNIAFDGKRIGTIRTVDDGYSSLYAWTYPRDRFLNVASVSTPPKIRNKQQRFAGWCQIPSYRPLVLVENGGYSDPDLWKPLKVSAETIAMLFPKFKEKAGQAYICRDGDESGSLYNYDANDVEALRSYRDNKGNSVITLRLKQLKEKDTCDSPPNDPAWDTHSFLVTSNINYLGAGLDLIDAGDYDTNGKSEILFWYGGYNRDGYVLYSNNFANMTAYKWSYH